MQTENWNVSAQTGGGYSGKKSDFHLVFIELALECQTLFKRNTAAALWYVRLSTMMVDLRGGSLNPMMLYWALQIGP